VNLSGDAGLVTGSTGFQPVACGWVLPACTVGRRLEARAHLSQAGSLCYRAAEHGIFKEVHH